MASEAQVTTSDHQKIHPDHPWLLRNGKAIPEETLKVLSQNWDAFTWERYLEWFETPRSESLIPPKEYYKICAETEESIFINAQSSADDDLKSEIDLLLQNLTPLEAKVVRLVFWEGRSERFISNQLNLSRSTVRDAKRRALNRIKRLLIGHTPISRIMRGKDEFAPLETGERHVFFNRIGKDISKAS